MSLTVILGMGVVAALSLFMVFKLRDTPGDGLTPEGAPKHFLLQLLFLFLFLSSLVFIANAVYKADSQYCQVVTVNDTVNMGVTTYESSYVCYNTDSTQGESFYRAVLWIFRLSLAYIFFYFVYEVLKFAGWVVPKE